MSWRSCPCSYADRIPGAGQFVLLGPCPGGREKHLPDARIGHAQIALKLRRKDCGADVAFTGYRGNCLVPESRPVPAGEEVLGTVEETYLRFDGYAVILRRREASELAPLMDRIRGQQPLGYPFRQVSEKPPKYLFMQVPLDQLTGGRTSTSCTPAEGPQARPISPQHDALRTQGSGFCPRVPGG